MWKNPAAGGFLACLIVFLAGLAPVSGQQAGNVFVTDVKGAIGVATVRQVKHAIEAAKRANGSALVIRLDTPGGLVSATRDIIQEITSSPVPVIVYVAPAGARAASAGTFIVYASHLAAMAPGTNIGAATPVSMGGLPGMPGTQKDKEGKEERSASEQKAINDIVAMLRSLAQLRGRNLDFADKAVREAATMTSDEALKANVIEIVANDMGALLAAADGRKLTAANAERTLNARNTTTTTIEPDWQTRLLTVISDPNVAFLLLMIGFYGIILEFWNPGTLVAGTVGAICLILGLVALSALPVHWGAAALVLLGLALMVAEALTPGIGILGVGGIVAFIAGAIFLFDGEGWDIDIALSWPVIVGTAATTALVIFGVAGAAARAHSRPPQTGAEEIIGSRAEVIDWSGLTGTVRLRGEIWFARAERALEKDAKVRVIARDGLTLTVEPA